MNVYPDPFKQTCLFERLSTPEHRVAGYRVVFFEKSRCKGLSNRLLLEKPE